MSAPNCSRVACFSPNLSFTQPAWGFNSSLCRWCLNRWTWRPARVRLSTQFATYQSMWRWRLRRLWIPERTEARTGIAVISFLLPSLTLSLWARITRNLRQNISREYLRPIIPPYHHLLLQKFPLSTTYLIALKFDSCSRDRNNQDIIYHFDIIFDSQL